MDALFEKFTHNSEGKFEINESMENIFGTISKIERESYPEKWYGGVKLQPESWESFSLASGIELLNLITNPTQYQENQEKRTQAMIDYAVRRIEGLER